MICYLDKTFCPFYEDCNKASQCDRPLTEAVILDAFAYGLPTAQYTTKPECHEKKEIDGR